MAEMEFEFSDSPEGGQFMATGKVINFLRGHLGRGEVDEAVALYESCVENVGDQLWKEFPGSSVAMRKAMANMFFRARDYQRAAAACEALGEWSAAGKAYEGAYDLPRAVQCYLKAGSKAKAAAALEKSGELRKAAELYFEVGELDASAGALERANDPVSAAQVWMKKNDFKRAAQILATVQSHDPAFLHAVALIAEALVRLERRDLAVQRLMAVVPRGAPIKDAPTAELGYRLGRILIEMGHAAEARPVLEAVRAFNPSYKDTATLLEGLGRSHPSIPASPTVPVAPVSAGVPIAQGVPAIPPATTGSNTPTLRVAPVSTADLAMSGRANPADPFAALDGNPFLPKSAPPQRPAPAAETVPYGVVTRMEGYEVLKKLPIFADLSLDEMKAFFQICDQVYFKKGDQVIEQGVKGEALYIVREGSLRVCKVDKNREVTLATLPAGNYVGEMALIDDSPTSARVLAAENVKALRIRRDRFEQLLNANDRMALRVYRSFLRTVTARLRETNAQMARS